jgi:hypothetical protein
MTAEQRFHNWQRSYGTIPPNLVASVRIRPDDVLEITGARSKSRYPVSEDDPALARQGRRIFLQKEGESPNHPGHGLAPVRGSGMTIYHYDAADRGQTN